MRTGEPEVAEDGSFADAPRLRDLPPAEDLLGVVPLVRAAVPLRDLGPVARHRIRAGLHRSLSQPIRRRGWRLVLRPAVVLAAALLSASVGGAAIYAMIAEYRLERAVPARAPEPGVTPATKRQAIRRPKDAPRGDLPAEEAETSPPASARGAVSVPSPLRDDDTTGSAAGVSPEVQSPPPVSVATTMSAPGSRVRVPDAGTPRARPRLAMAAPQVPTARVTPAPMAGPAEPAPASETAALADAIRALRVANDPQAALALLDAHQARFPGSPLAPEIAAVRVEALLKTGRPQAALAALDRFPLDRAPGSEAWLVVRGELRAGAGRWHEAERDFSDALASRLDGSHGELAERALWGRAVARARLNDVAGEREDRARYLERFPGGRFSAEARRWSGGDGARPAAP